MEDGQLLSKRIAIVDDEPELAFLVKTILANAGFSYVESFTDPQSALDASSCEAGRMFQLFILDVMMPAMDGYELLARLKSLAPYARVPAIFLTAKDEPSDKVSGLMVGADDYITKPFLPQELVLRVKALLRRCYSDESTQCVLEDATIDFGTAEAVRPDGSRIQLTAKEFEIIRVLDRNAGRIVTIDALCEALWGTGFGYENSLMAHIRRLREKIERDPSAPKSLVTIKGLGYKLNVKR